ncbi:transposase [Rhizobium paknamense]|uniref:Transposase n=2 Tax=Rhizobium paknamense TaxID=1206817 RepID=A0ABU0IJQ6_9HYPH|nr:transposase [Rhizobium paknamense]MDQ0458494.1 transposase [Rhizobium paknamense]
MTDITIGADISKDHIDLHSLPDGRILKVANDRKGFAAILKWIGTRSATRIVYEPTGPYHKAFERFMMVQGLALAKVNPRFARRFAEATGRLAKTDRIDAAMLARYGALLEPRILQANTQIHNDLKELHVARLALIKDRTAAKNRSKTLSNSLLKRHNAERLRQIERQIKAVDDAIMALIAEDAALKARFDILVSIPGVAQVTAFTLLIEMPELGELDEKAAAALAGLAPMSRQSGRWTGRAFIAGGRAIVRHALYMPALVACRRNPDLSAKYDQLKAAGKPSKIAITAVMRKLIVLANALLKKNRKWVPKIT